MIHPVEKALAEPNTHKHIRRMLKLDHESGFVAYTHEYARVEISDLLLPDPDDLSNNNSEVSAAEAKVQIDMAPLLLKGEVNLFELEDAIWDAPLTDQEKAMIEGIRTSSDLTDFEKEDFVDNIRMRALKRIGSPSLPQVRTDLRLVVHNHPQNLTTLAFRKLLVPSGADIYGHENVQSKSPGSVSGIVAGDAKSQGIILYAAEVNRSQDAPMYESDIDKLTYDDNVRLLRCLAKAGFVYLSLLLTKSGTIAPKQDGELTDFLRQIKTK